MKKGFELSAWVHLYKEGAAGEALPALMESMRKCGFGSALLLVRGRRDLNLLRKAVESASGGPRLWAWLDAGAFVGRGEDNLRKSAWPAAEKREFGGLPKMLCPTATYFGEDDFSLLEEIASSFAGRLSGVHMDYIRYPNACFFARPCVCKWCRKMREEWLGRGFFKPGELESPAVAYKEIQSRGLVIRSLMRKMRERTKQAGLRLGMAARTLYVEWDKEMNKAPGFGYGPAVAEGQDWKEWAEEGLLDRIDFMNYTTRLARYKRLAAEHKRLLRGAKAEWFEGPCIKSSAGANSPSALAKMIGAAKDAGAAGATIFTFSSGTAGKYVEAIRSLRLGR